MMRVVVLDPDLYPEEVESGRFLPKYEGDAGIDVRAREDVRVHAGETVRIPLGLTIGVPRGYVGWVTGRSTSCLEFGLITHEGKIDSGYRGEIHAFVSAQGSPVHIKRGERIAQLVLLRIAPTTQWRVEEEIGETQRGKAGLGSTGRM